MRFDDTQTENPDQWFWQWLFNLVEWDGTWVGDALLTRQGL